MGLGVKTGGRKKGTPNKKKTVSALALEATKIAVDSGETPLAYMLRVMRDPKQPLDRRDDMARAAAPYVHARAVDRDRLGTDGLTLEDLIGLSYAAGKKAKPD